MLAIVVHENMKLGDNTLNNERLTLVNTKFQPKYYRIVALILLPYNISIILKLKGHIKARLILRILNFLKKSIERFKNYLLVCLSRPKYSKTAHQSAWIHTNQIFLSSNLHDLSHTFLKRLKLL